MKIRMFVILIAVLLLTACSPAPQEVQTSGAVVVNPVLFDGLLIFLFTMGTIYLFEKFGLDLRQFAVPVAVTVSTALVGWVQGWVTGQPIEMDPWIMLGLRILEALLAGFGALRVSSRQPATLITK